MDLLVSFSSGGVFPCRGREERGASPSLTPQLLQGGGEGSPTPCPKTTLHVLHSIAVSSLKTERRTLFSPATRGCLSHIQASSHCTQRGARLLLASPPSSPPPRKKTPKHIKLQAQRMQNNRAPCSEQDTGTAAAPTPQCSISSPLLPCTPNPPAAAAAPSWDPHSTAQPQGQPKATPRPHCPTEGDSMEHPCIPKDISPYLPQLLWNLGCTPPPQCRSTALGPSTAPL